MSSGRTGLSRAKRIRVPGVPADFRVPPGWPVPTDRWIRENALWHPPNGWAPLPNIAPAPAQWRFWVPNELGRRVMGRRFRSIAWMAGLASAGGYLFLALVILGAVLDVTELRLVAWGIGLGAVTLLVAHESVTSRRSARLLAEMTALAERGREERLKREYQHYLRATA